MDSDAELNAHTNVQCVLTKLYYRDAEEELKKKEDVGEGQGEGEGWAEVKGEREESENLEKSNNRNNDDGSTAPFTRNQPNAETNLYAKTKKQFAHQHQQQEQQEGEEGMEVQEKESEVLQPNIADKTLSA